MSGSISLKEIRRGIAEIIQGFSSFRFEGKSVYIKHFNQLDNLSVSNVYDKFYAEAIQKGLLTEETALQNLANNKSWTSKDESNLYNEQAYLENLRLGLKNCFLEKDIEFQKQEIKNAEKKVFEISSEREVLIGLTAEKFANAKANNEYIYYSLFKDSGLNALFFSKTEFDELEAEQLEEIILLYNQVTFLFNNSNIRFMAVSPILQNMLSLCEKPYEFFGKPIAYLSFYQYFLLSHGFLYKNIFSQSENIPEDVKDDPDKLEEWLSASTTAKKIMEKNFKEGAATSIVGATEKDYKRLGLYAPEDAVDINALVKDKGMINMADYLKFHEGGRL